MADLKISALPAASAAADANEIPINEAGTTKKVTVAQIKTQISPPFLGFNMFGGASPADMMEVTISLGGTYINDYAAGRSYVTSAATNNSYAFARLSQFNGSGNLWSYALSGGCLIEYSGLGYGVGAVIFGGNGMLEVDGTSGQNHIAFAVIAVNGVKTFWALSGNGTQTATSLGAYDDTRKMCAFKFTPGVSVKFYVNGSLVATHTNNLPSGEASQSIAIEARNKFDSAVARTLYCHGATLNIALP